MMVDRVFYTVLEDQAGYPVKYFDRNMWKVQRLNGPYSSSEEATQAFLATVEPGFDGYYLPPEQFKQKVNSFAHTLSDKEDWKRYRAQKKGQQ
jgi:hypothetical protein